MSENIYVHDHKDSANRYTDIPDVDRHKDHYLRSDDGKLKLLRVQKAPGYVLPPGTRTTWEVPLQRRLGRRLWSALRGASSHVLSWTFDEWLSANRAKDDAGVPNWSMLCCKYPIACIGLTLTALFDSFEAGGAHQSGKYPPIRYRYFCYPKFARNSKEKPQDEARPSKDSDSDKSQPDPLRRIDSSSSRKVHPRPEQFDGAFGRHLRPRKLCVIPDDEESPDAYVVKDVDRWDRDRRARDSGEYVFVSYTRSQYQTYTKEEIERWDPNQTQDEAAKRSRMAGLRDYDLEQLCQVGIQAAQKAGVSAFWIDVLCMTPDTAMMDSHRICDIARGANRLVIAIKDRVSDRIDRVSGRIVSSSTSTIDQLLEDWASRLWTLPEMLLAPTKHDIEVYRSISTSKASKAVRFCETIAKRNMAERAYIDDGLLVRQLVDHFESNLQLTRTELYTIGLQCLMGKKTKVYTPADPIYALMALARRRPLPDKETTLFEAFALSLLNDSNMLLEKLICLFPPCRGEPWYKIDDFWGAKLWDVDPHCQVAGIGEGDTVILDGAFGASIEWSELRRVGWLKRKTFWRIIGVLVVSFGPGWFIFGISILSALRYFRGTDDFDFTYRNPVIFVGIVFFLISLAAFLTLPAFMISLYRGKFWSTQALLIGIEGVPDLDWLEKSLFGFSEGRLKWSPYSSTQSRHSRKEAEHRLSNECMAVVPSTNPLPLADGVTERNFEEIQLQESTKTTAGESAEKVLDVPSQVDKPRLFTLVDTYNMSVTTFWAVHPPSALLICGLEGGMRRAALCSYNYKTQTFHRETILRIPSKVLDRMDRVDRFRFSMESMPMYEPLGHHHGRQYFDLKNRAR